MNEHNQLTLSTNDLKQKKNLSDEDLVACIHEITNEEISVKSKKDFLKALAQKGETEEEFAVFIREFRKLSVDPELEDFAPSAIDLCGTGGDKSHSFNISTFVSFMVERKLLVTTFQSLIILIPVKLRCGMHLKLWKWMKNQLPGLKVKKIPPWHWPCEVLRSKKHKHY